MYTAQNRLSWHLVFLFSAGIAYSIIFHMFVQKYYVEADNFLSQNNAVVQVFQRILLNKMY